MSQTVNTLDNQLFTSEAWRPANGLLNAEFKDVTLKVQIGEFPAGSKFPYAVLVGDASALVLVDDQKGEHGFRLNVSVGDKLSPEDMECHDENCTHHH